MSSVDDVCELMVRLGYSRVKIFYSEPAEHMDITVPYVNDNLLDDLDKLRGSFSEEFTFTVAKSKNPFKMPLNTYEFETIMSSAVDSTIGASGVIGISFEELM